MDVDHRDLHVRKHTCPNRRTSDLKDDTIGDVFGDGEEESFGIRYRLNENWSIRFQHRRDLIEDRARRTAISLGYQDECFLIEAVAQRTNYRDRELEEDDSIFVRVVFKYLGGVSGG